MGGLLAAAIFSSGFRSPLDEFQRACDGIRVSNVFRQMGQSIFLTASRLTLDHESPGRFEERFADACGISVASFRQHLDVHMALDFGGAPRRWRQEVKNAIQRVALGMVHRSAPSKFPRIEASINLLSRAPVVRGCRDQYLV